MNLFKEGYDIYAIYNNWGGKLTKEQKEELIERIMDNMSVEMRHFNAKYYKIGFCDGLRLVIECLNNNWTNTDLIYSKISQHN